MCGFGCSKFRYFGGTGSRKGFMLDTSVGRLIGVDSNTFFDSRCMNSEPIRTSNYIPHDDVRREVMSNIGQASFNEELARFVLQENHSLPAFKRADFFDQGRTPLLSRDEFPSMEDFFAQNNPPATSGAYFECSVSGCVARFCDNDLTDYFSKHLRNKCENGDSRTCGYRCFACGVAFPSGEAKTTKQSASKRFADHFHITCKLAKQKFPSYFANHLRKVHAKLVPKNLTAARSVCCSGCGLSYTRQADLNVHLAKSKTCSLSRSYDSSVVDREDHFGEMVRLVAEYKSIHGIHKQIPARHVTEKGVKLGPWLRNQKIQWKKGNVPDERLGLLREAGVNWDAGPAIGKSEEVECCSGAPKKIRKRRTWEEMEALDLAGKNLEDARNGGVLPKGVAGRILSDLCNKGIKANMDDLHNASRRYRKKQKTQS